jgi:hypothetical protein
MLPPNHKCIATYSRQRRHWNPGFLFAGADPSGRTVGNRSYRCAVQQDPAGVPEVDPAGSASFARQNLDEDDYWYASPPCN